MQKPKLWIVTALVALAANGAWPQNANPAAAGFVLDVKGDWIDSRTGQPLRRIDSVQAGDAVTPKQPAAEANFISISLYDKTEKKLRCSDAPGCKLSYQVPKINAPDPWYQGIVAAALKLYPAELKKLVIGASRGDSGPVEAVAALSPDGLPDLASALAPVNPGQYTARLLPWPKDDGAPGPAISAPLVWHPPSAAWQAHAAAPPGLYQLELSDARGERVGSRSALLIPAARDQPRFTAALARLNQTTNAWDDVDSDSIAMRNFRIAFLVALAGNPKLADDPKLAERAHE